MIKIKCYLGIREEWLLNWCWKKKMHLFEIYLFNIKQAETDGFCEVCAPGFGHVSHFPWFWSCAVTPGSGSVLISVICSVYRCRFFIARSSVLPPFCIISWALSCLLFFLMKSVSFRHQTRPAAFWVLLLQFLTVSQILLRTISGHRGYISTGRFMSITLIK